jgi:translation initiation factor IF-2
MLFAFNKVNRSRKFLVSKDAVSDGNLTASNHRNQQQRVRTENSILVEEIVREVNRFGFDFDKFSSQRKRNAPRSERSR